MTKEQLKTVETIEKMWTVAGLSEHERAQYRTGLHILAELDWPAAYIKHPKMYLRAEQGLVMRYKDMASWTEYRATFANEDISDSLEREKKLFGTAKP